MGADDAVNIILNAKYVGKTEVGNSKDATSLDNMLNAIRWMKSVNDYRKSVGLSELQVTYKLIAGAIADANYRVLPMPSVPSMPQRPTPALPPTSSPAPRPILWAHSRTSTSSPVLPRSSQRHSSVSRMQ